MLNTKFPSSAFGPVIKLAVKIAPDVLLSFVNTLPVTLLLPFGLATTVAKSAFAIVLGLAFTSVTVIYTTAD